MSEILEKEKVKKEISVRDYYKVLLVGPSGDGKTMSFKDMNPLTTGFINVENKPLPFKNNFKYHSKPDNTSEVLNAIKEYATNSDITAIALDSFSAFTDMAVAEGRATKKGFDIWNYYNETITKFNSYVKKTPKEMYITAHYEILGIEGSMEKRVKVKGREWEGTVEKDYAIVLYSGKKYNDGTKRFNYYYDLVLENGSAKCPPLIFGEDVMRIDNDVKLIDEKIKQFSI